MVEVVNSNRLEIHKVTNFVFGGDCRGMFQVRREDMGAYLCIASNDVPPAVSKRVYLMVQCEFLLTICSIRHDKRSHFSVPPSILPGLSVVGSAEGQKVAIGKFLQL